MTKPFPLSLLCLEHETWQSDSLGLGSREPIWVVQPVPKGRSSSGGRGWHTGSTLPEEQARLTAQKGGQQAEGACSREESALCCLRNPQKSLLKYTTHVAEESFWDTEGWRPGTLPTGL